MLDECQYLPSVWIMVIEITNYLDNTTIYCKYSVKIRDPIVKPNNFILSIQTKNGFLDTHILHVLNLKEAILYD